MSKKWLKGLKRKWISFLRDEEGQSTTEYILILAIVVLIAVKFKEKIATQIGNATDKIGGKISSTVDELGN